MTENEKKELRDQLNALRNMLEELQKKSHNLDQRIKKYRAAMAKQDAIRR